MEQKQIEFQEFSPLHGGPPPRGYCCLKISIIMQKNKGFSNYFTSRGPPWDTPKSTPGAPEAENHNLHKGLTKGK